MGRRGARGARPDPPRPPLTPHAAEEFETTVVEEQEEGAALEDEKMLVGRRVYVRRVRPATPPAGGGGAESSGWGAPGAAASGLGPRGRQSPWAPSGCPRPSLPPSRSNLAWKTSWQVGPGSAAAGGGGAGRSASGASLTWVARSPLAPRSQDLKDKFRECGNVVYSNVIKDEMGACGRRRAGGGRPRYVSCTPTCAAFSPRLPCCRPVQGLGHRGV